MEDRDFASFAAKIREKTAIDLSQYKEAQMKRRLTTLRMKHGYSTFQDYLNALQSNEKLMNEFLDRMTINVSEFWRNPNRWRTLEGRFFPEMVKENPRLKIWSAACSTGEEPYTLAMILDRLGVLDKSSILATDLDVNVIEKALVGDYHERSVRDVPPEYLKEYFIKNGDAYSLNERLKKAIRFKQHNLLYDRFEGPFDLIVCRNVMIYFTENAKQTLYHNFSKALRPGGLLFVGSTEQIFSPGQYNLETVETFFYRRCQ
ncbi:protein-glutamate O-methyltransferase CheR [Paenibacillus tarimensis]